MSRPSVRTPMVLGDTVQSQDIALPTIHPVEQLHYTFKIHVWKDTLTLKQLLIECLDVELLQIGPGPARLTDHGQPPALANVLRPMGSLQGRFASWSCAVARLYTAWRTYCAYARQAAGQVAKLADIAAPKMGSAPTQSSVADATENLLRLSQMDTIAVQQGRGWEEAETMGRCRGLMARERVVQVAWQVRPERSGGWIRLFEQGRQTHPYRASSGQG